MIPRDHIRLGFGKDWSVEVDLVRHLNDELQRLERDVARVRSLLDLLMEDIESPAPEDAG